MSNIVNVAWMYPDILNLHGERGNAKAFELVSKKMGVKLNIDRIDDIDSNINYENYDILLFNAGELKHIEKVKERLVTLLNDYNSKNNITIYYIIEFHYEFERIHPFQDGNGRVGRLIILKECLKHNIVPFIITEQIKDFYYRGLKNYKYEKGYLNDTCLSGQDIVKSYLDYFKIEYK